MEDPKLIDARDRLARAGFNVDAVALLLPLLAGAMGPAPVSANEDADPDRPMRYDEAAAFLGYSVGTLQNLVADDAVPHLRLGPKTVRFQRRTLLAWLATLSRGGNAA